MRLVLIATLTLFAGEAFAQTNSRDAANPQKKTRTAANVPSECDKLWEPATHMSKREWARTCERVQGRLQEIQTIEDRAIRLPKQ